MQKLIERIRINAPARHIYQQLLRFELFPYFTQHMMKVERLDAARFRWHAVIAGKLLQGECEITEQSPPHRLAWHSSAGQRHAGAVECRHLTDSLTQLIVVMAYEPGTMPGWFAREIKLGLDSLKDYLERQIETTDGAKKRPASPVVGRAGRRTATNALPVSRKQWALPH